MTTLNASLPPRFPWFPTRSSPSATLKKPSERPHCSGPEQTNIVSIEAGTVPNIVPAAAKAVIADLKAYEANPQDLAGLPTRTMEAEGRSKHASMPDGSLNAVGVLARKLLDEGLVNPAGRKLLELLESLANDIHGELTGTARDDEALGNTSQVGSIARTEGRTLYYTFDTRFPAIAKADEIAEDLQRFYDPQGISFEVLRKDDAIPQDPKAPLIGALTRIVNEELGTDLKPYTMGGGTYARKLPNAYAFGLEQDGQQPPSFLPDGQGGVHQPNEALNIAGYMQGIAILIKPCSGWTKTSIKIRRYCGALLIQYYWH